MSKKVMTLRDVLKRDLDLPILASRVVKTLKAISRPIKDPGNFRVGIDRPKVFSPQTSIEHLKQRAKHLGMMGVLMAGRDEYDQAIRMLIGELDKAFAYLTDADKGIVDRRGILTAHDNVDLFNLEVDDKYNIRPIIDGNHRMIVCRTVNEIHGFWASCSNLLARAAEEDYPFTQFLAVEIWEAFTEYFSEDEARQATLSCFTYGVTCLVHYLFKAAAKIAGEKNEELEFEHFLEVEEQGLMTMLISYGRISDDVLITL